MESLKEDRTTLLYFYQQVEVFYLPVPRVLLLILTWGDRTTKLRFWRSQSRKLILGIYMPWSLVNGSNPGSLMAH